MRRRGLGWRYRRSWLGPTLIGVGALVLALILPGWFWPVALGVGLIAGGLFLMGR